MTIYTYNSTRSLCAALGIDFTETPEISDQMLNTHDEACVQHFNVGTVAWTGQKHTDDTKRRMSESQKQIPKSDAHKKALSSAAKKRYEVSSNHPMFGRVGKDNPKFGKHYGSFKKEECPNCKKLVALNNIKRYHYENCKWNPDAN